MTSAPTPHPTSAAATPWIPRWPGWRHLPRDARDTLFLLGVIAWTILPHVANLPLWCTLLAGGVLLWRARLAVANASLPHRWVLVAVLVVAAALTWWSYRSLLGKAPGVTLAVVLMALKTLELRARRDAFVVFFLGFFLVLTHFLYSQSLLVAAAMLVSVWGLLTALVLAHMPVGQPSLRQAGRLALRTALLGAPLMALLFVLFPRIGPLWGVPGDDGGSTGLSNSLRFGSIAEVAVDDRVALRVRFLDRVPAPQERYFRGPVLSYFDGREWTPGVGQVSSAAHLQPQGAPLRYEITLEPQRIGVLPLLEMTTQVPELEGLRVRQRGDLVWSAHRPVVERLRFTATAHTAFSHGPLDPTPGFFRQYLQLPPGYAPRAREWAAQRRAEPRLLNADASQLAAELMRHVRSAGFTYTLSPGVYGELDARSAIDEFWLDRKEGFCEHFAAAFVVLMREMGVPARVVTGFQGTDPFPVDGFYVVRNSAAHAWAEYWQPGRGWVRADPTAAVAPDRIDRNRNLTPPPGFVAEAINNVNPQLLVGLRQFWETVNNRWNQWVLNYSRGQQLELLKSLGYDSPRWEDLALLLITLLSTAALAGAGWAWWDRRRQDPWQRQAQTLRRGLQRLGLQADAHAPPRQLATEVRRGLGTRGEALARLLETLDRQRYGRASLQRPSSDWWREVRRELQGLRGVHATPPSGAATG